MGMLMKAMMIATSPPSSAVSPQSIESLDMWVSRPRLENNDFDHDFDDDNGNFDNFDDDFNDDFDDVDDFIESSRT